jgi:hypothetical protein
VFQPCYRGILKYIILITLDRNKLIPRLLPKIELAACTYRVVEL